MMNKKVLIIAEAGVNHDGDFERAKELVDVAAEAGADFVKFQTFNTTLLTSEAAETASYQQQNSVENNNQFSLLKKLELPREWHFELIEYAKSKNIAFLSTGFDETSVDFLNELDLPFFKIPSGELTNKPYLQHIARKKRPIILSTGMATLNEIRKAVEVLVAEGLTLDQITVLHCNTEYPTPMQDVNLIAMRTIASDLGVMVGYSDHTLGIEIALAAVALGAKVIEKHFTLDKNLPGPDHRASLEPKELKAMVKAIRNIEMAISGDGIKKPSASESKNITAVRKSIHLRKNMNSGDILREADLIMLRPGDGVSPMEIDQVVGRKIAKKMRVGDKLSFEDLA